MPIALYRNAFLIYNPSARGLDLAGVEEIDRVLAVLAAGGHNVTLARTRGPGTGGQVGRECVRSGADLILVAGGDGTINEVANGVIHSQVPFGILPGGTANILATEMGLAGNMEAVARQLGEWVPRRIAVGLLTASGGSHSRYFLMVAGVGLDAHIVTQVDPELKKMQGKLSYWIAGLAELGRELDEFDARVGEWSRPVTFALASRVKNYGSTVVITPDAGLLRDDFAMALFEGRHAFRYLTYLGGVITHKLEGMEGVTLLHSRSAEFTPCGEEPVFVQVDGELAGALPAKVEIVADALTLLMPPRFLEWTT
ncbi:MAG: diacylglycerol kinase family protein [Bryobacteraceae bacterium]